MSSPSNCPKFGLVAACRGQFSDSIGREERLYVFDGFAGWDPDYRYKAELLGVLRSQLVCWATMFRMKKGVTPQFSWSGLSNLINLGLTLLRFLVNLKILVPHCLQRPTKTRRDPCQIRVITSRAYHALFMHNMLIRPTEEEPRL